MPKHEPNPSPEPPNSSLVLYVTEDGRSRIECRFEGETIWLTQALMAELFKTSPQNITLHLKAIYDEGELKEPATCKEHLQVRSEGARKVSRTLKHYSLEAILAVGYRVRSPRGTQFRQWATARLSEYLRKGFAMDDERLRNPPGPGVPDYFDELLERIRDIRASEKRMYLRVREILALASDYSPTEQATQEAFKIIQNKLTYAATGHTSAEIIAARADASKPNMGLTSWKGGVVRKTDVSVAKNYLSAEEIDELNRIVVMFLDFAEDNAKRRKQIFLSDWKQRLDEFLAFNERRVLRGAGKVSHEKAIERGVRSSTPSLLGGARPRRLLHSARSRSSRSVSSKTPPDKSMRCRSRSGKRLVARRSLVARGTGAHERGVKAHHLFNDPEWDGDPVPPETAEPRRSRVKIRLADGKERMIQAMSTTRFYAPDGRLLSARQLLENLFGAIPDLFRDENELRRIWSAPSTRKELLARLSERGFGGDQLEAMQRMVDAEKSDLYDVLAYTAFTASPVSRQERAAMAHRRVRVHCPNQKQEFLAFVLDQYVRLGVEELDDAKLPPLLRLKYRGAIQDAIADLGQADKIRPLFIEFQRLLYEPSEAA